MGEILILFIYKRQKQNDNNNNNKIKKIKKSNQIRMVIKGVIAHQFKAYSTFKIYFEGTVERHSASKTQRPGGKKTNNDLQNIKRSDKNERHALPMSTLQTTATTTK
jgi:hypothetical protein